jgi:hypothetical protein
MGAFQVSFVALSVKWGAAAHALLMVCCCDGMGGDRGHEFPRPWTLRARDSRRELPDARSRGTNRPSVVLPVRIELTTSPLPRGCSTTELRQQTGGALVPKLEAPEAGDPCHKGFGGASCSGPLSWPREIMREQSKQTSAGERRDRLRSALRENLKRRKAQAKGRALEVSDRKEAETQNIAGIANEESVR